MNQKKRMLSGLPYLSNMDGLEEERENAKILCKEYNNTLPSDSKKRKKIIDKLLGSHEKFCYFEPPIHFDYGKNIYIGESFYSNYNLVILDCAKVEIGSKVMFGPNVCITTAGHPIHPISRTNKYYEYAQEIKIGDMVWIGANVVINPGVSIGSGCVIGSGSVVTCDIPPYTVAVGVPCKVIRQITDKDRDYYYKDRKFDVTDY